ncbi:hypothetical protein AKO1_007518 [Acrasis kona]|uniref:50S ribosomal protein L35 n=1 Tax=Acrasis kona TaxID=1008807 RepID=A0AAW2YRY2_9EUKA
MSVRLLAQFSCRKVSTNIIPRTLFQTRTFYRPLNVNILAKSSRSLVKSDTLLHTPLSIFSVRNKASKVYIKKQKLKAAKKYKLKTKQAVTERFRVSRRDGRIKYRRAYKRHHAWAKKSGVVNKRLKGYGFIVEKTLEKKLKKFMNAKLK